MDHLLSEEERRILRENFAIAVQRQLSKLRMTLDQLSGEAEVSEAKLTGQESLTLNELRRVVGVLWPGREPSDVDALWPHVDSTGHIEAYQWIIFGTEHGLSIPELCAFLGGAPVVV